MSKPGRMSTVTKNTYDSTLLSAISEKANRIRVVTRVNPSLLHRDGFLCAFKTFKGVIVDEESRC
ncbi:hypothetical protein CON42_01185 [Bacillus thuringiensis]|nr:hypothetical protein CON42_01185 [Bacillus thuringiensis]